MKQYSLRVTIGSKNEAKVKKYLEKKGISYLEDSGLFNSTYFKFRVNKKTWKKIKKDLNLSISVVYCIFDQEESEA